MRMFGAAYHPTIPNATITTKLAHWVYVFLISGLEETMVAISYYLPGVFKRDHVNYLYTEIPFWLDSCRHHMETRTQAWIWDRQHVMHPLFLS